MITLNTDGSQVAVAGSRAAVIKLYHVDAGVVCSLIGHLAQITTLAFSPDGQQLASGSMEAAVRLWDTASGDAQAVLKGPVQEVTGLADARGGRSLASMGNFEAGGGWNRETATDQPVD